MKHFVGILAILFGAASLCQAQNLDDIVKQKISAASAAPAAVPIAIPASAQPWYFGAEDEVKNYFDANAVHVDLAQEAKFYINLIEQHDLIFFGEDHSFKAGPYAAMLHIKMYNRWAEKNKKPKVTHIFYEFDKTENKEALDNMEEMLDLAFSDAQRERICRRYIEKKMGKNEAMGFIICDLMSDGVIVKAVDLGVTEKKINGKLTRCVAGTDFCTTSPEGMTIRNKAIFKEIKSKMPKKSKAVFFGGAMHVAYGNVVSSVTLTDIAAAFMPDKKIVSVINHGGKWYNRKTDKEVDISVAPPRHFVSEEDNSKTLYFENYLYNKYTTDKTAVLKIVPQGQGGAGAYANRPADYLVFQPNNVGSDDIIKLWLEISKQLKEIK
ncbi:hypothetical protein AAIR98_000682 [Elusimicrobium simillimum]|uniref:hypothetical protein n=1 Tax=Elusimicrobium simillimum TaxID=3143438 RepID=UPI003C6F341D